MLGSSSHRPTQKADSDFLAWWNPEPPAGLLKKSCVSWSKTFASSACTSASESSASKYTTHGSVLSTLGEYSWKASPLALPSWRAADILRPASASGRLRTSPLARPLAPWSARLTEGA